MDAKINEEIKKRVEAKAKANVNLQEARQEILDLKPKFVSALMEAHAITAHVLDKLEDGAESTKLLYEFLKEV